jgi:hypothetical protein
VAGSEDLAEAAERLGAVAEHLADLALDRLRLAADPDEPRSKAAAAEERRIALLGAAAVGDEG